MHVTQVAHRYRPAIGGVENYVARLNDSLRAHEFDVSTITTDWSLEEIDSEGTNLEESIHYCKTTGSFYRNPLSIELYQTVKNRSADMYHLHSLQMLTTLEAANALGSQSPMVLTIHGAKAPRNTILDEVLFRGYRPFAQYILNQVDHTIVLGTPEREWLVDTFDIDRETVSVIPNGIHPDRHEVSSSAVKRFERKHDLVSSIPTILYVSRLVPLKGPDVLVDAITQHLPDRDINVVMIGSGEPEYIEELRQRADDRFRFLSNLPFEELKAGYHAADVFALPSTFEGLPTVILEAMNARLPVVTTSVGAIPDVITEENGSLIDTPREPEAVATALQHYLEHPEERVETGERNRQCVREQYDWDDIADEIMETYYAILDDNDCRKSVPDLAGAGVSDD